MTGVTDDLAEEYDVLIVGTDISQSLIAGACSRVGITVLHIDANDYYGGTSASFDLDKFVARVARQPADSSTNVRDADAITAPVAYKLTENERLVAVDANDDIVDFDNAAVDWHTTSDEQRAQVSKISRKFSIDLTPKVLLARGHMVETLIRSGVSRYAEFVSIDQLLAFIDDKIFLVPCTRGQVFASSDVAPMDKRRLMKLITTALDDELHVALLADQSSFQAYLAKEKFSPLLQDYVLTAITAVAKDASVNEGITALRRFCHSVGRYGQSPFIACLYGSGELAQCFCRLCAVYGGVYVLRQTCASIVVDDTQSITAVVINGRLVRVKHVVLGADVHSRSILRAMQCTPTANAVHLQRAVVVSEHQLRAHDRSEDDEKMKMSLMNVSLSDGGELVGVLHGGVNAQLAPKGYYVTHVQSSGCLSAVDRLSRLVESLFPAEEMRGEVVDAEERGPSTSRVMTAYWDMATGNESLQRGNVFVAPSSGASMLDYGHMIAEVEAYFASTFADKQFLPEPIPFDELKEEHDKAQADATTTPSPPMSRLEASHDDDKQEVGAADVHTTVIAQHDLVES